MGSNQDCAVIAFQVVFKPALRLQVKIIRRFIQQQDIGIEEQKSGQFDTCLPAATELRQRTSEI
ncbi:hypothetical protein ES703_73367 [subsurface metagenome]